MTPAAPAAPQRAIAIVWDDTWKSLERDLARWARRTAQGKDPLTVGEQARLRSLIAAVRELRAMQPKNAQIAAAALDQMQLALDKSYQLTIKGLPAHVGASATGAAQLVGSMNLVNVQALQAVLDGSVGQLTTDFTTMSQYAQRRMVADLATSIVTGEGPRDLAKRIAKSIEPAFGTAQTRSVTIARTTMARAYDKSRETVYAEADAAGLLHGWMWQANGKRPCDVCLTLHGTVFAVGDEPYRHPNCTCSTVPVLLDGPGSRTPIGSRYKANKGTSLDDLELSTSASGYTNWTIKKK